MEKKSCYLEPRGYVGGMKKNKNSGRLAGAVGESSRFEFPEATAWTNVFNTVT